MTGVPRVAGALEQEIKLGAWPGFELPDLTGVVPGATAVEASTLDLDARYVDTADLRLVRRGVSLRRRTGEGATRWTLKLPDTGAAGAALSRREIEVETDAEVVPPELADLLIGWVRRTPLHPVTTIRTRRRRVLLQGEGGVDLAELADDEVVVVEADEQVAARFREIEVELAAGAPPEVLTSVAAALEAAGAGAPDKTTKVVRALGPRALAPADLAAVEPDRGATVGDVATAALRRSVRALVDHDHVIRLDDDPEGVHAARVATRRLRSDLRTLAPALDVAAVGDLRVEVGWLAAVLGEVRDLDVMGERLRSSVDRLDPLDRADGALVVQRLVEPREQALDRLLTALRTDRYLDLLERLVDLADRPPLTREARAAARSALPRLVRPAVSRLRRAIEALGDTPSDDDLHAVRILAKRARYATEVAAPVTGDPAPRLVAALAHLQDVLGELHDTEVAVAWLRSSVPVVPHAQAMVLGQLVASERRVAADARDQWRAAWAACDRRSLTRWLS